MAKLWDADVHLSPETAARLIERQFPALAPVRLESLSRYGTGPMPGAAGGEHCSAMVASLASLAWPSQK